MTSIRPLISCSLTCPRVTTRRGPSTGIIDHSRLYVATHLRQVRLQDPDEDPAGGEEVRGGEADRDQGDDAGPVRDPGPMHVGTVQVALSPKLVAWHVVNQHVVHVTEHVVHVNKHVAYVNDDLWHVRDKYCV